MPAETASLAGLVGVADDADGEPDALGDRVVVLVPEGTALEGEAPSVPPPGVQALSPNAAVAARMAHTARFTRPPSGQGAPLQRS
ncbi:hypothetical protein GCM10027449_17700 [Sinomonas notoginsengisoli]|uniref:hypothetical protein n=1 Tax=Sinomonas notoginsengisoli TaxID=1457311 RepID=UPI001F4041E0|nr:hypothetical protein [Sinomonas notoginsengisoli]